VIAYSTMSQIGYMIMGVCSGAYAAGLFHLYTHAFFKATLFMAAGSIIAAMGGEQSLDKMSGFRRALPFTYAAFVLGGLALAGIPPFSGFFSKDEILLLVGDRGGWWIALYVAGYVGAFLTAIYTFRMIFRAFHGEPCPEARELEDGHLHHAETPFNPATGEAEDSDVGFPGPEHHIAERAMPMKAAMSLLLVGTVFGGFVQIPKVDQVIDTFLRPTFADSRLYERDPSNGLLWFGLVLGTVVGLLGIALAYRLWVVKPGSATVLRERFAPAYELFVNKWYFDELYDRGIVRPMAATGRFAQNQFERLVIDGGVTGGVTGVVRAFSSGAHRAQSGFLRLYAALLVLGIAGVSLYFLIVSS
jgi:NADH-quinone oxidoreductase subunit L